MDVDNTELGEANCVAVMDNKEYGYIYIRSHPSYDIYNAIKLGKTINIPDRDTQYSTGEIMKGKFTDVFEVSIKNLDILDILLKHTFKEYNIKYTGGTEFYNKKIINMIEPYLKTLNIMYKKLNEQEINNLVRCNRYKDNILNNNININELVNRLDKLNKLNTFKFIPRDYQNEIIDKSINHFKKYDKGLLVISCGCGKTLISLWITQQLNLNTILIGVPNKLLLEQWKKIICELFINIPYLLVSDNINIEDIKQFIQNNKNRCIIITTYSSTYKIYNATQNIKFVFDMKINDEAHHLTGDNLNISKTTKKYIQMFNIKCNKQLSLTATLKQLNNGDNDDIISNDNIKYFGNIIDKRSLLWAINNNIVCDYVIQTIIPNNEQLNEQLINFNIIDKNNRRMFLSAFASLKSISNINTHHLLIYSNNKENSKKIIGHIKKLLDNKYFDIPDLYYSDYNSEMNTKKQDKIINEFRKSKFGIISCVYCLGEGWDFPL